MELAKSSYHFKRSVQLMNLIVRNVDPQTTEEEFQNFFSNFGEIRKTKVIHSAGIGFVCFMDRESARKAKETPNLILHNLELSLAYCEPKESRQKQLEEKFDKKAFERQRIQASKSSNSDVLTLITSLSLLMSQLQNGGQGGFNVGGLGQTRMVNRPYQ